METVVGIFFLSVLMPHPLLMVGGGGIVVGISKIYIFLF